MTRNEVFEGKSDFINNDENLPIKIPMTKKGFEEMTYYCAAQVGVPVDDDLRKIVCGFIHSLDRKCDEFLLESLKSAMRKSYANQLTWVIDKEIDAKIRAASDAVSLAIVRETGDSGDDTHPGN